MAKSLYTEALVKRLLAVDPFTYESAVAFAESEGLKVRSVIAKGKSLEMVYVPKPVETKTGEPVTRKNEIISDIAKAVKVDAAALVGLQKSTKGALQTLLAAVSVEVDTDAENA